MNFHNKSSVWKSGSQLDCTYFEGCMPEFTKYNLNKLVPCGLQSKTEVQRLVPQELFTVIWGLG